MDGKFQHTIVQCLTAIAQHHGLQINPDRLIHEYALANEEPASNLVLRMATDIGLKAKDGTLSWDGLFAQEGVFPILARLSDGTGVIIAGTRTENGDRHLAVLDPAADMVTVALIDQENFCRRWSGDVIFLKRSHALTDPNQPFSLRWYLPEIWKQKTAFRDIIIAALALTVLGMASPIFFQLVIDKVLVHQSASTLSVLTVGIVIAILFEALFGYLRSILLLAATNKIDMHITRLAFGHLLS